ncbi:MAG: glycosyltransferase family 39 protein [Verrucomicrobiota bacterium]
MNQRHTTWFLIAIFATFSYLGFTGLDNAWFWDDEAFASITARNLNRTGELTAWDGRNLATYNKGVFLTKDLVNTITPVHFFIVAQSQRIFGTNTFAGRFPSVLFGLSTLFLLHKILSRQFGRGSLTHLYMLAIWALASSPLLFCRTGRYYSLMLALFVGSFYLYTLYVEKRHPLPLMGLVALAILGYFTHPLIWIASYSALAVHFLIFHIRSLKVRDAVWITLAALVVAVVCLPVLLKNRDWYTTAYGNETVWFIRKPILFWYYLRDLNLLGIFAWPSALAMLIVAAFKLVKNRDWTLASIRPWADWAVLGVAYLFFLCIFSRQPTSLTAFADMRYAVPALPFLTIFLATACVLLHKRHWALGVALALVCTMTNALGYLPTPRWTAKWLLPAFVREIHNPYPTAVEAVTAYLNEHANQDDIVYVVPDYETYPLMFYLGDRIKLAGILTDSSPPKAQIPGDPDYLYTERAAPDWIVFYGLHVDPGQLAGYFGRQRESDTSSTATKYTLATILDTYWGNTQKPEPAAHQFTPITDFDPAKEGIIILRRVTANPPDAESP